MTSTKPVKLRDNFSANVNAKDGSTYFIPAGGELVTPHVGKPIELADGEYDRLEALGAFTDPGVDESLLRIVNGVANQPTPQLASNTAPEGEEVTTPGVDETVLAPQPETVTPAPAKKPARKRPAKKATAPKK